MQHLPNSVDAELDLIATLIHFNEAWLHVRGIVKPKDFYTGWHDVIFEHIGKLIENGDPANVASVEESIDREHRFGADFYRYLRGLFSEKTNPGLSASNALKLAKIVREKALRRSMIDECETIIESVQHPENRDITLLICEAEARIFGVAESHYGETRQHLNDVIESVMEQIRIRSKENTNGEASGLETGFADLDRCIQGLKAGDLVLLASRPGMGKRDFAMKIVEHLSIDAGQAVLVFSLERSAKQLGEDFLASRAAISRRKIRCGSLSEKDLEALEVAATELRHAPVVISDQTQTRSIVDIRAQMRRTYRECGHLGLVVIDSLQNFAGMIVSDASGTDSMIREIKRLAEELSVPILALSDLSKKLEARDDKRPQIIDLRRDGINDQWADVVLSLYRDDHYNPDSNDRGVTEIHVLKNCSGPTGMVHLESHGLVRVGSGCSQFAVLK